MNCVESRREGPIDPPSRLHVTIFSRRLLGLIIDSRGTHPNILLVLLTSWRMLNHAVLLSTHFSYQTDSDQRPMLRHANPGPGPSV